MRRIITIAALGLSVAGCHKSIDQRFKAMCADVPSDDPEGAAELAQVCKYGDNLSDQQKKVVVDADDEYKREKARILAGKAP